MSSIKKPENLYTKSHHYHKKPQNCKYFQTSATFNRHTKIQLNFQQMNKIHLFVHFKILTEMHCTKMHQTPYIKSAFRLF